MVKLEKKNVNFYDFGIWLLQIIPKFIKKISLEKDELIIYINIKNLRDIFFFLKKYSLIRFSILIDITAVDYLSKKKRLEINYFLLSIFLNLRLRLKLYVNEIISVPSITSIYSSANWFERETWDMYGVFFFKHPDLRRLLTDYGFEGFPFRKDFPQSGYFQVQYNNIKKHIIYKPLNISQEYRFFNFVNPWIQNN